jgi:hypothetical protein
MKSKSRGEKLANLPPKVASNPETKDQEPIGSSRRYPSRSREASPIVLPNPKKNKTAAENVGEMASVEPTTAEATSDTVNIEKPAVEPMVEETKDKDGATPAQQKARESPPPKKKGDDSYDPSEDEDDEDEDDEDDEDEDEGVDDVLPPTDKGVVPKNKRGRQIKKVVTPQGQFPNSLGIKPNIKSHIKPNIKSHIKPNIKSHIKPNIKSHIKTNIKSHIKTKFKSHILFQTP